MNSVLPADNIIAQYLFFTSMASFRKELFDIFFICFFQTGSTIDFDCTNPLCFSQAMETLQVLLWCFRKANLLCVSNLSHLNSSFWQRELVSRLVLSDIFIRHCFAAMQEAASGMRQMFLGCAVQIIEAQVQRFYRTCFFSSYLFRRISWHPQKKPWIESFSNHLFYPAKFSADSTPNKSEL